MDINSLLSPQNSPDIKPAATKTVPPNLPRTSSNLNPDHASASREKPSSQHPQLPQGAIAQAQQVLPTPPALSSGSTRLELGPLTQSSDGQARQVSTPGMDALADLASMQHHQQIARATASGPRSADVLDAQQRSMSHVKGVARARASPRPGLDQRSSSSLTAPVVPRTYMARSLSESDLASIASLASDLAENPYLYESHLKLIGLLRKGLMAHVEPPNDPFVKGDPHTYELLQDLREARETMASRFPSGESLWADWISDEILLAKTIEDRIGVIELCQRAVAEELGSVRLWLLYGNWVFRLFHASRPGALGDLASKYGIEEDSAWSDEDKAVGAEVFGWDTMLDVWRQGARATEWRIHDGHLIWDRYAELLLEDLANGPNQQKVSRIRAWFDERLQIPHATWDQTFSLFSTFVTNYDNASYEESMVSTNKRAADAKTKYSSREMFELRLNQAMQSNEELAIWTAFTQYLEWEVGQVRKKTGSHRLTNALFERAVLQLSTNADLWEDYVFFIIDSTNAKEAGVSPLAVLQRATRHCPWSGTLWAQYLLSSESEDKPFQEVEEVKHKATSTGLMDIGGMEEVLKAYAAWCAYLNRRAFHDKATDEEADVAEVGIRSAIESVKELGEKKHGKDYAGDPNYRLQRIYVEYLSRSGLWDRARTEVWKSLVPSKWDSYEFWLRWYHWEMMYWYTLGNTVGGKSAMPTPTSATAVLRQAVTRHKMDWPEKILEVYMDHVRDFESVGNLQAAVILVRKISKSVAKRRQQEAEQAVLIQQQQEQEQQVAAEVTSPSEEPTVTGKRKRDSDADETEVKSAKKSRPETKANEENRDDIQQSSTAPTFKRDRENNTVIVRKIPLGVSETKVRQFFRDCGKINSLKLTPEHDDESLTATIEFDSTEDVLAAQTKDMKYLEGHAIEVQVGKGTTLYVTNFPPAADESFLRDLFKECGEIVDVRFPSLKFNTHRRFCYVQFRSSEQAEQATRLDGKEVGEKLKLVAKISDPGQKRSRTGALHEGRELHISNLDWNATEDEVGEIFSKYGTVERVRLPKNLSGNSKGFGFVVFSSREEAEAALDMNLTRFKSRILNVSLSTANNTKRQATTIVNRDTQSKPTSPTPPNVPSQSKDQRSPTAPHDPSSNPQTSHHPTKAIIQSRTLALLNIPDTINSARIRSLMEPYGALVKIALRPDHQGATVEYANTNDAGKAALGIEGFEIAPGRRIRVGTVKELLGTKEEVKPKRGVFGSGKDKEKEKEKAVVGGFASSGIVKRPALGAGGVRRGGLGRKRGFGGFVPRATGTSTDEGEKGKGKEKEKEKKEEDTVMGEYGDTINDDGNNEDDHKNNNNDISPGGEGQNTKTSTKGKGKDDNINLDQEKEQEATKAKPKGKSNADFKALFLGSGEK
ncbi:MAG: Splicing factor [Peltula sp. TS41687]|nr:MAG: Splicing factor [Peltula sp. TS41687]